MFKILFTVFIILLLYGCGGSDSFNTNETLEVHKGFVIDSPIINLSYTCGEKNEKTKAGGLFTCSTLPVTFKVANIEIGELASINQDSKVYLQDILNIPRDDFQNKNLLKLALLIQSVDDDNNISEEIMIPENIEFPLDQNIIDLTENDIENLLKEQGITPLDTNEIEQHLREFSPIDTLAPIIVLNGKSTISITEGERYIELGASVSDDRDLNVKVITTGSVDTSVEGNYTIRYNCTDESNNQAIEVTRTVIIEKEDSAIILGNATAIVAINGRTIPSTSFVNSGGEITSCTVSPTLPTGLSLASDCTITGTATSNQAQRTYTVTATNDAGSTTATVDITVEETIVLVSGTITYDSVPFGSTDGQGLDYDSISQEKVKGVIIEAIDASGNIIATTVTNKNGQYNFNITSSLEIKIRVKAQLYQVPEEGKSSWDFKVVDNTNSDALYVMDGSLASTGTNETQTRNLNASSGWGGTSYTSTRTAAPFSILSVIYKGLEKLKTANSSIVFPPLLTKWSKNNIAASGDKSVGEITTSHYDGTSLYILGKENSDTDEYDVAVIGHEWGHYFEGTLSRSDSIGGQHGGSDMLDIRVAFGEGFGTAWAAMILDESLYRDSLSTNQSVAGWTNLENGGLTTNAGWYNEASIYHILYDLYDDNNDQGDTLSLGFTPIYNVLVGAQKNTPAFTSIFTFIKALKDENPGNDAEIDAITSNENIAPITDIYGLGRTNRTQNANPLYSILTIGTPINIAMNYSATSSSNSNKLGKNAFVIFEITATANYTINISGNQNGIDPDLAIYKEASNSIVALVENEGETDSMDSQELTVGKYRMYVTDYNNIKNTILTLTLTAD